MLRHVLFGSPPMWENIPTLECLRKMGDMAKNPKFALVKKALRKGLKSFANGTWN